jgi:hypothetical protein
MADNPNGGNMKITHRKTGVVLYAGDHATMAAAASAAVSTGANLSRANLSGANLSAANLTAADLSGANLPCGRNWEQYQLDPLAGICRTPEARARAVAARDGHSWADCPMHAALGIGGLDEIKEADTRRLVAAFVAVHDGRLLDAAWDRLAIDTDLDEEV